MRWLFRYFWLPFYRTWALRHIQKERLFHYGDLQVLVPPGIFHPGIFFSTPIFLNFLKTIDFNRKNTLDVGTGSGALALFAAQNNARAVALDINPLAVLTAEKNAAAHGLDLKVYQSDLFDALPDQLFDIVLINPPYYPQAPANNKERAFFAGPQLEYFEKLFRQLPNYLQAESCCWMILSEDCNLKKIQEIASRNKLEFSLAAEKRKWGERFGIWRISLNRAKHINTK